MVLRTESLDMMDQASVVLHALFVVYTQVKCAVRYLQLFIICLFVFFF